MPPLDLASQALRDADLLLSKRPIESGRTAVDIDTLAELAGVYVKDDALVTEVQERGDLTVALIEPGVDAATRRWVIARACAVAVGRRSIGLSSTDAFDAQRRFGDDCQTWKEFTDYVNSFAYELLMPRKVVTMLWRAGYPVEEIAGAIGMGKSDIITRARALGMGSRRNRIRRSLGVA